MFDQRFHFFASQVNTDNFLTTSGCSLRAEGEEEVGEELGEELEEEEEGKLEEEESGWRKKRAVGGVEGGKI